MYFHDCAFHCCVCDSSKSGSSYRHPNLADSCQLTIIYSSFQLSSIIISSSFMKPIKHFSSPKCDTGIESVYWWEGKVQTDAEGLLIIKIRESLLNALTEHVANHEYDVPEVIALPISRGNPKYLEWLKNNTKEN